MLSFQTSSLFVHNNADASHAAEEKRMAEEIQADLKKKTDQVEKELVLLQKNLEVVEAHLAQL